MYISSGNRPRDDQGSSGVVNQDGVHLIDHRKVVLALYQVIGLSGHVVPEVIEAKFIIGTVNNIATIGFFPRRGVGLVLVDAVHREAVKFKYRGVPFGVTLGQVVIDRNQVYPSPRQGIEEGGKGRHEGFSFSCTHFRDLSFVENHATDQLHIVVNHVPDHFGSSCHPFVVPNGLITL